MTPSSTASCTSWSTSRTACSRSRSSVRSASGPPPAPAGPGLVVPSGAAPSAPGAGGDAGASRRREPRLPGRLHRQPPPAADLLLAQLPPRRRETAQPGTRRTAGHPTRRTAAPPDSDGRSRLCSTGAGPDPHRRPELPALRPARHHSRPAGHPGSSPAPPSPAEFPRSPPCGALREHRGQRLHLTVTGQQGPATFGRRALTRALHSPVSPLTSNCNEVEGRASLADFRALAAVP